MFLKKGQLNFCFYHFRIIKRGFFKFFDRFRIIGGEKEPSESR